MGTGGSKGKGASGAGIDKIEAKGGKKVCACGVIFYVDLTLCVSSLLFYLLFVPFFCL